jgi:pullulanase
MQQKMREKDSKRRSESSTVEGVRVRSSVRGLKASSVFNFRILLSALLLLSGLALPAFAQVPAGFARIHYFRPDGNYSGWAIYTFNATLSTNTYCSGEVQMSGSDSFGIYFDVPVNPAGGSPKGQLGLIINNCGTGTKDPGPDQALQTTLYNQGWVVSGNATVFTTQPTQGQIASSGFHNLQAFWIDRTTVAIPPGAGAQSGWTYSLLYSTSAGLSLSSTYSIVGGTAIPLSYTSGGFTPAEAAQFPQLAGYTVLNISSSTSLSTLQTALTGQVVVQAVDSNGNLEYVSGLQNAGVLDDLFYYPGSLGAVFSNNGLSITLWAPTAQSVKLLLYANENDTTPQQTVAMTNTNGVWSAAGQDSWKGQYYLYDISVYVPNQFKIIENIVTDPYSPDITVNATKTHIVDLNDVSTKPAGWDQSASPVLTSMNDMSLYELHVREFSIADTSVPAQYRGTYLAFTYPQTTGMNHLAQLATAGLKAVHIMPSNHIGSVNEDETKWLTTADLSVYPPDGQQQQAAVNTIASKDAYNYGYDPVHYFAPNGGFAFNPDNRVEEFRAMVMGLHNIGLRVIQDVVFNHTYTSGQSTNSVLDEIVPNYYYRLNATGTIDTASCCSDTASEHRMFEKLMIDHAVQNAVQFKIDGYRYDTMSFHFVSNLQHVYQALQSLNPQKDGVDGSKIYLFGEGFQNSETAPLGLNATQENLYGTGVGTFNDRIRDGIRGGDTFDQTTGQVQGFATGLFTDPSYYTTTTKGQSLADQKTTLNLETDWIRTGLAGGLRDFTFVNSDGATVKSSQITYKSQPAGYTQSPLESVNYCSVHDNYVLFDAIQLKSAIPGTTATGGDSIAMRARRQVLAMSLVALGQGIPYFYGGDDLLTSKDMDYNSYNSGDWFNKIDWTGLGNNWGIGLPLSGSNKTYWPAMQPLLANAALKPQPTDISYAASAFQEFLQIRYSSSLFRMTTAAQVQRQLQFLNSGPTQTPGLIVMELKTPPSVPAGQIVVVFNATTTQQTYTSAALTALNLQLHPIQQNSADPIARTASFNKASGTLTVPALTTSVFVSH